MILSMTPKSVLYLFLSVGGENLNNEDFSNPGRGLEMKKKKLCDISPVAQNSSQNQTVLDFSVL